MAAKKFTRIPKTSELVSAGVPTEAIPTYCALADHANNKTGLCWPKMETLAKTLGRSVRTIQRHLHLLRERGLIEFVERRRHKGRFSSYLYRVLHIVRTTGHGRRVGGRAPTARFSVIDPHRMMQACGLTDGFVRPGIVALTYGQVSVNATRCKGD